MKIKDVIGNELHSGNCVFWQKIGSLAHVIEATPEGVRLEVKLMFPPDKKQLEELVCGDLMRVVDPQEAEKAEKVVEKVLSVVGGKRA
jgi:hypothetical protein